MSSLVAQLGLSTSTSFLKYGFLTPYARISPQPVKSKTERKICQAEKENLVFHVDKQKSRLSLSQETAPGRLGVRLLPLRLPLHLPR